MEVNKEQAEKCRDLGARALKSGDFPRAVKLLKKSLQLYPLPGVDALLSHATSELESTSNGQASSRNNGTTASNGNSARRTSAAPAETDSATTNTGSDGRSYTDEQVKIVKEVLRAKEGGRGAHYRVLKLQQSATEAEIKKAYRKLSLKVHPDKNSAPHADEAFKAVGLAYATLSDTQKRTIYDRYGDEDPDNRGGGMRGPGGMHMRPGQEVSPEEIFNMFFGGGMPGGGGMHAGGPGFHFYTNGFGGPGMHFRPAGMNRRQRRRGEQQEQAQAPSLGMLLQFLPMLLIMLFSFFRYDENASATGTMPGEGKYFSLSVKPPFTNALKTRLTPVRDIPYFVSDRFLRTYYRDRYQLAQVERMVERAYEQYLIDFCGKQKEYKRQLQHEAAKESGEEKLRREKQAREYELTRCSELTDLFPNSGKKRGRW